jgi:hypothetical protein
MRRFVICLAGSVLFQLPAFQPHQPDVFAAPRSFTNAFADFDGDMDVDLFVGFNGQPNRLYQNDGGVFTDVADRSGVADARPTRAAAWGDFDGDADADLLVGFAPGAGPILRLYRNDGGRFRDVTEDAGLVVDSGAVRQPSWIDYDGDGDADLFIAFRDRANMLYRNDGGRFTDIASTVGLADARRTVGAVWFDYDMDGDLDLYTGNMDGDANGLFRNNDGRFEDVAAQAGVAWGGRTPGEATNGTVRPCVADVDRDGRFDLFMANYGRNGLFLNRGSGRFEDASETWGIAIDARYDSCAFADIDNDGRVDLYVNGTVTGGTSYRDYLFRNTGEGFEDVTPSNIEALQADHGVQWADTDRDGDIDLALTGATPEGMHNLMLNGATEARSWRSIQATVLDARRAGSFIAGAEVRIYDATTNQLLGTALMDTGSGYNSQNAAPLHFGVGNATRIDVEVIVPRAGVRTPVRERFDITADERGSVIQLSIGEGNSLTSVRVRR